MRKRSLAFALLALLVLSIALAGCSTPSTSPGGSSGSAAPSGGGSAVAVTIQNFAFSPSSADVSVGGTVTWTNKDSATHNVTGDGWESGPMATGATFSKKFDTAGTVNYHCSIHPSMTGTINVK